MALTTFVLTLAFAPHLETGILVGVLLSLGLYIYRTMSPHIYTLVRDEDGSFRDAGKDTLKPCPKIAILRFKGSLFFANTTYLENRVLERVAAMPGLKYIIVNAGAIYEIDATGEDMLRTLSERLDNLNISFLFARVQVKVMAAFRRTRFLTRRWSTVSFAIAQQRSACEKSARPIETTSPTTASSAVTATLVLTSWGRVPATGGTGSILRLQPV